MRPLLGLGLGLGVDLADTSLDIFKDKLKISSSELSTECAFAASANLRGINHLIIIIIIIIIIKITANPQLKGSARCALVVLA